MTQISRRPSAAADARVDAAAPIRLASPIADRPGTMLLTRRGLVLGISLLTAAGWLVLSVDHPSQRADCLAALAQHYPQLALPACDDSSASVGDENHEGAGRALGLQATGGTGKMAPRAGFEPATNRLTAGCSTTELPGNTCRSGLPHGQGRAYIRAPEAVKAELQGPRYFDVAYQDWQIQSPRSPHKGGADGAGWRPAGGWRLLVATGAGALDGAGRACGAVGRFSARAAVPAAKRSEDAALVAGPPGAPEGRARGGSPEILAIPQPAAYAGGPFQSPKEKGPGEPGPKLGKWWGVFMGRQERHWAHMVNKWLTVCYPQGHLGHSRWFSSS